MEFTTVTLLRSPVKYRSSGPIQDWNIPVPSSGLIELLPCFTQCNCQFKGGKATEFIYVLLLDMPNLTKPVTSYRWGFLTWSRRFGPMTKTLHQNEKEKEHFKSKSEMGTDKISTFAIPNEISS